MRRLPPLVALLTLFGCGAASTPDAGQQVSCEKDPRVFTYAAGMSRSSLSGALSVTLVDSAPAPPARGNNTWTIRLAGAGTAVPTVLPFMPDHGHGSSVNPVVTPNSDGTFKVDPLYFFMPGVWRITIGGVPDGGASDAVEFFFCVAG